MNSNFKQWMIKRGWYAAWCRLQELESSFTLQPLGPAEPFEWPKLPENATPALKETQSARLVDQLARFVLETKIVKDAWKVLEEIQESHPLPVILDHAMMWVLESDLTPYNSAGEINPNTLVAKGPYSRRDVPYIASRSCLLSFLSLIRGDSVFCYPSGLGRGLAGFQGIYCSIGAYYRFEEEVTEGVREPVFPQLEVEVIGEDPEQSLEVTLDMLQQILTKLGVENYEVRIQGEISEKIMLREEVRYAGVDRMWKHYKTKKNIGFEAYVPGQDYAIAGGGDFSELAKEYGLNPAHSAVGFGLGLLRVS